MLKLSKVTVCSCCGFFVCVIQSAAENPGSYLFRLRERAGMRGVEGNLQQLALGAD